VVRWKNQEPISEISAIGSRSGVKGWKRRRYENRDCDSYSNEPVLIMAWLAI
jgi:hypothetical protein